MKNPALFVLFIMGLWGVPFLGSGQIITTIAGNGTAGYIDAVPVTNAEFYGPQAVKFDRAGNMYIADFNNNVVRKISTSGVITTIAGTGTKG
jgi:hypothetical protein